MTHQQTPAERLQFLAEVVEAEARYLLSSDKTLFDAAITPAMLDKLADNESLAVKIDAFAVRFGRLQDNLGDKLLPALLTYLGEKLGAFIDNLNKAERLNFVDSAQNWIDTRNLRNQLIHEYIKDMDALAAALNDAHVAVPHLVSAMHSMVREVRARIS